MKKSVSTTAASAPQPGALVNEDTITQCQVLKAHLEAGNSFTGLQALDLCGCLNYKGRVWDLRQRYKLPVVTTMTKLPNGKRVAVYSLATAKKED